MFQIVHWSDLIASSDKQSPPIIISDTERKRREAVWELFKSECVFLIDHLMVLKHVSLSALVQNCDVCSVNMSDTSSFVNGEF